MARQKDLRKVVGLAVKLGIPIPCLMASLAYFDGYRNAWLPANLIQASVMISVLIPTSVWMPKVFSIRTGNRIAHKKVYLS